MERKLIDYLPYVIRDYAEFQGIMGSEQPEIEKAWNTTDDLLDNQFIPTAGNMGLSRWEKILGITPKGTDSLEDRRFLQCHLHAENELQVGRWKHRSQNGCLEHCQGRW